MPVTALTVALVTACAASGVTDGRAPVSLADWEAAVVAEDTLELMIPSCFGEPELASLEYDDDAVMVEVITTVVDEGPACADRLRVELGEPLGDRQVVDVTSGEAMRLTRPTASPEQALLALLTVRIAQERAPRTVRTDPALVAGGLAARG